MRGVKIQDIDVYKRQSDDLLQDLIKVLDKYGIRDSTRLREALECLYILLTV